MPTMEEKAKLFSEERQGEVDRSALRDEKHHNGGAFKAGNPWAFKPGNPGGGRTRGSRDKVSNLFLNALTKDFEEHGEQAIVAMRERHPADYVKVIASLLPKTVELSDGKMDDWSNDELDEAIHRLRGQLASSMASDAVN